MPITTKYRKRCSQKVRYESKKAALFFAEADGLKAYLCPACGGFHLTSQKVRQAYREYKELK